VRWNLPFYYREAPPESGIALERQSPGYGCVKWTHDLFSPMDRRGSRRSPDSYKAEDRPPVASGSGPNVPSRTRRADAATPVSPRKPFLGACKRRSSSSLLACETGTIRSCRSFLSPAGTDRDPVKPGEVRPDQEYSIPWEMGSAPRPRDRNVDVPVRP